MGSSLRPSGLYPKPSRKPEQNRLVGGRYELFSNSMLGDGSFCDVYRGVDKVTDQEVAIKLAKTGFIRECMDLSFLLERKALSRINHPVVVAMLDHGTLLREGNELPYIVMEHVEGNPLHHALFLHERPLVTILKLFADICDALHCMHDAGVVHRDLNYFNLLLNYGTIEPKIIDFGCAQVSDAPDYAVRFNTIVGTERFLAPEQSWPGRLVDHRADIYALGMMMYLFFARNELPFEPASDDQSYIDMHRNNPVVPLRTHCPSLPGNIAAAVEHALSKDPTDRFQSALEMKEALGSTVSCAA